MRWALIAALLMGCGAMKKMAGDQPAPISAQARAEMAAERAKEDEKKASAHKDVLPDAHGDGLPEQATQITCNDRVSWDLHIRDERNAIIAELLEQVDHHVRLEPKKRAALKESFKAPVFWGLIRTLLIAGNQNNLGVVELKPLNRTLYRTGITPDPQQPGSCLRSLVEAGGVRHTISLYAGEMNTQDLEAGEHKVLTAAGGTYFNARNADPKLSHWRELAREGGAENIAEARAAVTELINEHVLNPPGGLRGNIHIHCGGGMHRTGMVVGILDRCLNKASMEKVERDYKRHVAWQSDAVPGGFEKENLEFISSFDCGALKLP